MAKYKISSKANQVIVSGKISWGERINNQELKVFEQQIIRGCLRPRIEDGKKLIYSGSDMVELKQYLQKPLSSLEFFEIVAQVPELMKRVETAGLFMPHLIMDLNLVFINEKTKELFMLYQPLTGKQASGNIAEFIEKLISVFEKKYGNALPFVKSFKEYLASRPGYGPLDIEMYVHREYPQVYNRIVVATKGQSGFITNDRIAYANHYQAEPGGEMGTTLLQEDLSGTTVLESEGTTVLVMETFAKIRRCKNDEEREIKAAPFVMGKGAGCDYVIEDNKAISRKHAVIEKVNGTYVITDENSTNGSYVNNKRLESNQPETLHDGDVIRLADEDFYFSE